jgi:hypothetical protein
MQNRLQYLVAMSHHQDTYHLDMVENHHCIIAVEYGAVQSYDTIYSIWI